MFDGIDVVTLPAAGIEDLLGLYCTGLGFTVLADRDITEPVLQQVWRLPLPPRREVLLGKPGSHGGWIRLVDVPGLPAPTPAGRPDREGSYALDFYVRGADRVEARISALGWRFHSEAQRYLLPGTRVMVRERMLEQPRSGLLHAIVEYRPGQTRCILGEDADQDSSEVVAAVFLTRHLQQATNFARDVLGALHYFSGSFEGPAVERMLGLRDGEGLQAALFRGPLSRNARLEFAATTAVDSARTPTAQPRVDAIPRMIAGCVVADLDGLAGKLSYGSHGVSTGVLSMADGSRRVGLASRYGAFFEFWDRTN